MSLPDLDVIFALNYTSRGAFQYLTFIFFAFYSLLLFSDDSLASTSFMPNNIFIFPSSTLILSHNITNCCDSQAQFPFSSFIMMLLVYFLTNILQLLLKNLVLFLFWFHSFASCSCLHNVQDSSFSNSFHKIPFSCPLLITYVRFLYRQDLPVFP